MWNLIQCEGWYHDVLMYYGVPAGLVSTILWCFDGTEVNKSPSKEAKILGEMISSSLSDSGANLVIPIMWSSNPPTS